jgi:hypothetical protein
MVGAFPGGLMVCRGATDARPFNMNIDGKLYKPSLVKEALCKHFNMPANGSRLTTYESRFRVSRGFQSHYYRFTLKDGRVKHRAFGKIALNNEQEYLALQHLMKTIPAEQRHIGRPIAILKERNRSLLLLEYLDGCSSPLTIVNPLRLFPNRALNITRIGEDMLDGIYGLQKHFPTVYRPLSSEDTDATPGQPTPPGFSSNWKASSRSPSRQKERFTPGWMPF